MDSSGKSFGLEYQRMNCIGCAPSLHIFCMVLEVRNEGAPCFALFCIFIGSMHKISACPVAAQPEQSGFFVSMDFRGLALFLQFVLLLFQKVLTRPNPMGGRLRLFRYSLLLDSSAFLRISG